MHDETAQTRCHRCSRPLAVNAGRPVPLGFKFLAAFSLAAFHGGAFLWSDFSHDYCGPCRRWLSFLAVLLALGVLGLAAIAFFWAMKQGFMGPALKFWKGLVMN